MMVKQIYRVLLLLTMVTCSNAVVGQGSTYNILDYGALDDTTKTSTEAIQAAVDTCFKTGGGTVVVPEGNFLTGTIVLKANVTLRLEEGAVIYASRDINEYRMPLEDAMRPVLIYANGAKNVAIEGQGIIHGRAKHTYEPLREVDDFIDDVTRNAREAGVEMKKFYIVPPDISLVIFSKCEDVRFEGIELRESTYWTLHVIKCKRVTMRNLTIYSSQRKGVNADGIDINCCQDVEVTACRISTGDDAIAIKSWNKIPTERIRISNCTVSSSSTALKIGTESHGLFHDILFENCTVQNSNRGLSIVVREGGTVDGVTFRNISVECARRDFFWWGDGDPILILLTKKLSRTPVGQIKNVRFENISAVGMGTSKIESTLSEKIEGLQFVNVKFKMIAEDRPDKRASNAIEFKHCSGIEMQNVTIEWGIEQVEDRWASAIKLTSCDHLSVSRLVARQGIPESPHPTIDLNDVQHAVFENVSMDARTKNYLTVSGKESSHIVLQNVSPNKHGKVLKISQEVESKTTIKTQ